MGEFNHAGEFPNEWTDQDVIDAALMDLVKAGFVEMSIGEDGEFYFQITDSGKVWHDNLKTEHFGE